MMNNRLVMLFSFLAGGTIGCSSAGTDTEERTFPLDDEIGCAAEGVTPVIQRLVGPSPGFVPRAVAPTSDGIWFTESQRVSLNHLTEEAVWRQLDAPFPSEWIFDAVVGADGNVWFDN